MQLSDQESRKAQLLLLKILKEVHNVCERNNIKYFLTYGTLIGAIRHEGFIPWDDDIDIGMLRSDYEKFCEIAPKELGTKFILQNDITDNGFALDYSKVVLKGTKWIENVASETSREFEGLWIDILPFDRIPNSSTEQKKQKFLNKYYNMLLTTKLKYKYEHKGFSKLLFYISKVISSFISVNRLKEKRRKIYKLFDKKEYENVTNLTFYDVSKTTFDLLDKLELHKFEDSEFYIPVAYDKILRDIYGDYMQIPPVEKRRTHAIIKYDFGEYN